MSRFPAHFWCCWLLHVPEDGRHNGLLDPLGDPTILGSAEDLFCSKLEIYRLLLHASLSFQVMETLNLKSTPPIFSKTVNSLHYSKYLLGFIDRQESWEFTDKKLNLKDDVQGQYWSGWNKGQSHVLIVYQCHLKTYEQKKLLEL